MHSIKRRKANWTGRFLRMDCLLEHVIEGKAGGRIQVTERLGRRRKQLLVDFKEKRGSRKSKEEARGRTVWITHFGRGCGPVVTQTAE